VIREQILEAARACIGTPFHHQGRLPGVGLDCVGLVVHVGKLRGLTGADYTAYPRNPNGQLVPQLQAAGYVPIQLEARRPGDLLLFWITPRAKRPQHLGIVSDYGLIHTDAHAGRVVEVRYAGEWIERTCGAYRFPGLED
jgi:cell wall-associated NlpC family hydrolase